MHLWRSPLFLFCIGATTCFLHAQAIPSKEVSATGVMVRMERVYDREDACVLLNRSGYYRLERHFPNQTKVYIGSLSGADLQKLQEMLNTPELQQLSQKDVHLDLNSGTYDQFTISIYRGNSVQELVFLDPESRKPFRDSLSPIVDWLGQVKKQEHTEIAPENANRCFPAQDETAPRAWIPPNGNYILFLDRDHVGGGVVERSCVVVYTNGKFRAERTVGRYRSYLQTKSVEGRLGETQVASLHGVLDDPALKAFEMRPNPFQGFVQDTERVKVAILRETKPQVIIASNIFGRLSNNLRAGGGSAGVMHYEDTNFHVLDPLQKWIKQNIENNKFSNLPDGKATECLPSD